MIEWGMPQAERWCLSRLRSPRRLTLREMDASADKVIASYLPVPRKRHPAKAAKGKKNPRKMSPELFGRGDHDHGARNRFWRTLSERLGDGGERMVDVWRHALRDWRNP